MIESEERISKADEVAGMFVQKKEDFVRAAASPISAKLPVFQVSKLDALAAYSGKSRTDVLSLVIAVGLEEILSRLDQPVAEAITELDATAMARLLGEEITQYSRGKI